MNKTSKYNPTDFELEVLQVLWDLEEAKVKDIHERLSADRNAGYTSVLKIMQIMHDKGILERRMEGKSHIYKPVLKREEIEERVLDKVLNTLYKGSKFNLVMSALGNYKASKSELSKIKELIQNIENKEGVK